MTQFPTRVDILIDVLFVHEYTSYLNYVCVYIYLSIYLSVCMLIVNYSHRVMIWFFFAWLQTFDLCFVSGFIVVFIKMSWFRFSFVCFSEKSIAHTKKTRHWITEIDWIWLKEHILIFLLCSNMCFVIPHYQLIIWKNRGHFYLQFWDALFC